MPRARKPDRHHRVSGAEYRHFDQRDGTDIPAGIETLRLIGGASDNNVAVAPGRTPDTFRAGTDGNDAALTGASGTINDTFVGRGGSNTIDGGMVNDKAAFGDAGLSRGVELRMVDDGTDIPAGIETLRFTGGASDNNIAVAPGRTPDTFRVGTDGNDATLTGAPGTIDEAFVGRGGSNTISVAGWSTTRRRSAAPSRAAGSNFPWWTTTPTS